MGVEYTKRISNTIITINATIPMSKPSEEKKRLETEAFLLPHIVA